MRPYARLDMGILLRTALAGALLAGVVGCGSDPDPTRPPPATAPTFEPEPGELAVLGGQTITFRVLDAGGRPIPSDFYVDGDRVRFGEDFDYLVEPSSTHQILARAVFDGVVHRATWTVSGYLVQFEPAEAFPFMLTGQTLDFSVSVSHGVEVPVSFSLDGQPVSSDPEFSFVPDGPGTFRIEAITEVLGEAREASWGVTVADLEISPPEGEIAVFPYEWITLRAARADGGRLDGIFTIEDYGSDVGNEIRYWPVVSARRQARGRFETTAGIRDVHWTLVDASTVPTVTGLLARSRDLESIVDLSWSLAAPAPAQEEPDSYLVSWSTGPFGSDRRDDVEHLVVPHEPGQAEQGTAVEGLQGLTTYYFRVFARDGDGQVGFGTVLTPATTDDAGSRIRVTGTAQFFPWSGRPVSVAGVTATIRSESQTLPASGAFDFTTQSNGEQVLELTGAGIRRTVVGPLPQADVDYPLLLLPDDMVPVLVDGSAASLPLSDYVRAFTANDHPRDVDPLFHRWSHYPVKVWVWPLTGEAGEQPSFDGAFRRAIDLWNAGAVGDERLFEYVAVTDSLFDPAQDPQLEGVRFRLYPAGGSVNLGELRFVRPASGRVAYDDPELLEVVLRRSLPNQYLVDRIVAHELGHALGLTHSRSESDLMHAFADLAGGAPRLPEIYVARFLRYVPSSQSSRWFCAGECD